MSTPSLFAVVGSKRLPVVKVSGGWTTVIEAGRPYPLRNSKVSKFVDAEGNEQAKPANLDAPKSSWPTPESVSKKAPTKPASRASGPKPAESKKAKAKAKAERTPRERIARPEGWKPTDALKEARKHYEKSKVLGKEGKIERRGIDCADEVATMLRAKSIDQVYKLCARHTGTPEAELRGKYWHLNLGMQRMNLGNRIRAAMEEGSEEE